MSSSIHWPIAATLSGMIESFFSLLAFVYWYSYSVTHWAKDAVYSAINAGAGIPPNTEGFAAFALMFLHPVTWLISWCAVEGMVRFLGAAFTENALGILPLVLLDKIWARFTSRVRAECPADMGSNWSSFLPWVRQRVGSLIIGVQFSRTKCANQRTQWARSCRSVHRVPNLDGSLHASSAVRIPTIAWRLFRNSPEQGLCCICCGASQRAYLGAR